ncbi:Rv1733c family protein [Streptomyces sp. NPDC055006]
MPRTLLPPREGSRRSVRHRPHHISAELAGLHQATRPGHTAEGRHVRRSFGEWTAATAARSPIRRTPARRRPHSGLWLVAFAFSTVVAVLCAFAIRVAVWHTETHAAHTQALHRHRVSATTLGEAHRALPLRFDSTETATARAAWAYPASQRHTAMLLVPAGTPVGGKVLVWVDDAGREAPAPRSEGDIASSAVATGTAAFGVLVLSAATVIWLRLRWVEARRLAEWDREWQLVEPLWSGRLRRQRGADDD